jgi:urease accessory protein
LRIAAAILALCCVAGEAYAHTPIEGVGGFRGGLLHPILVPAHALSLLALGLLIGGHPRRLLLLAVFAAALAVAAILITSAFAPAEAEAALLASGAVAGLLVAIGRPLPLAVSAVPVLLGGVALLLDSVPALPSVRDTLTELAGTALGATLVLVLVAGNTMEPKRPWLRIGVRVAGSWIAAAIALVLALTYLR